METAKNQASIARVRLVKGWPIHDCRMWGRNGSIGDRTGCALELGRRNRGAGRSMVDRRCHATVGEGNRSCRSICEGLLVRNRY